MKLLTLFKNSLKTRRAAKLEAAQAHPELEAFGLPMPTVFTKRRESIDVGAILRHEDFQV